MEKLLEPLRDGAGKRDVLRVLSDALLEKGDPWGEAIQLALDLEARFPGEDATIDGARRLRRLLDAHGPSWNTRVHGAKTDAWDARPRFFRAVPSKIDAGDRDPVKRLDGVVGSMAVPMGSAVLRDTRLDRVTELRVETYGGGGKLDLGHTRSVTRLSVPWLGRATVEALAKAPCRAQLESLRLMCAQPTTVAPADFEALVALDLPRLDSLALERLEVGAAGAEALRAGLKWKLKRLLLEGAGLGVKGTVGLLGAKWLPELRQLSLAQNAMGPAGAEALAGAALKDLVALDLSQTASAVKALVPFIEGAKWKALRSLKLNGCAFKGKAAAALAKLQFPELRELALSHCLIGDEGLGELSKSKSLCTVRVLDLDNNSIKGPGVAALGKSGLLSTVEELDLAHNKFQNTGAKGFAASKKVGALRVLTLGHNWLGVQGLKAMLANPALKNFEELREGMNNYATQFPRSFTDSKSLPLVTLRLGPETTTDALEALLRSPRVATLEWIELACRAFDDVQVDNLLAGPLGRAKTLVHVQLAWANALGKPAAEKLKQQLGPRLEFI